MKQLETITAPHDDIRLTPGGALIFESRPDGDWRERLFRLGAGTEPAGSSPSIRFWHGVGRRFLDHFQQAAAEFWTLEQVEGAAPAAGQFILPEPPRTFCPVWPRAPRRSLAANT